MTTQDWLHLLLVLHIAGFTVMAGTVVADTAISGRIRRYLLSDKTRALNILESTAGFPRMIGISAMTLLLFLAIFFLSVFKF